MEGFDDESTDGFRDGLTETQRTRLENIKIDEGEPSKRLSGANLYRMWSYNEDDDYHPEEIPPWFIRDKVTQYLKRQPRRPEQADQELLASNIHITSAEAQSMSQLDPATLSDPNKRRSWDTQGVERHKRRRLSLEDETELRTNVTDDNSLLSITQLDSITPPPQNKKRTRDAGELQQNKRRRLDMEAPNLGPLSTSQLDTTTTFRQNRKRARDSPETRQSKRRRLSPETGREPWTNEVDDSDGQQQASSSDYETDAGKLSTLLIEAAIGLTAMARRLPNPSPS